MIQLVTIIGVLKKCYRHLLVDNCNNKLEKIETINSQLILCKNQKFLLTENDSDATAIGYLGHEVATIDVLVQWCTVRSLLSLGVMLRPG